MSNANLNFTELKKQQKRKGKEIFRRLNFRKDNLEV